MELVGSSSYRAKQIRPYSEALAAEWLGQPASGYGRSDALAAPNHRVTGAVRMSGR
jgi:hypothetical protein